MDKTSTLKFLKNNAIWVFIVLELIFFSVAGEFLSLSDKAFMDGANMLLLFKQSAPIGIIALGMTIVMINGNIDLSVGATYALCAVVMLDSMTWPIFAGLCSRALNDVAGIRLNRWLSGRGAQPVVAG
jgi:ribose transport system permease protein